MIRRIPLLCLSFALIAPSLLAEGKPLPADRYKAAHTALVAEADDLHVGGLRVGRGAQPARFYTLVRELAHTGSLKDFKALFASEHVVIRAAGMYCLANKAPSQVAFDALNARTQSATQLTFIQGCCVEEISEGELAQRFLANVNLLVGGPERPLVDYRSAKQAFLKHVEKGLGVGGSAVGFAGQPSAFFKRAQELAAGGTLEDFQALLAHEHVVVRAAGMHCMATQAPTQQAANAIKALQASNVEVEYQEGCIVAAITEGELAKRFLANGNFLDVGSAARPLDRD